MAFDPNQNILRNNSGDPIPQYWDDEAQVFKPYEANVSQKGSKATNAVAVTPDDANDLEITPTSALQVGGSGDVKVEMEDGTTIVLPSLTAGVVYPYSITRVYATDTTATNVIALY